MPTRKITSSAFTLWLIVLSIVSWGCDVPANRCSASSREVMVNGAPMCWPLCPGSTDQWCGPGYEARVEDGGDVVITESGRDATALVDVRDVVVESGFDAQMTGMDTSDGFGCEASTQQCSSGCTDLQSDPNNCGRCANRCPAAVGEEATCTNGMCGARCAMAHHRCAMVCEPGDSVTACGMMCETCSAPMNAMPVCTMGACGWVCRPGYERVGMGCEIKAPRLIWPMSTSYVTSQRPTLRWELPAGVDGAALEICANRACAMADIERSVDVVGSTYRAVMGLRPGVHFWRVRGRIGALTGTRTSATWEFFVGHRDAPIDTSWGSVLDINGDGYADVAVGDPGYTAMGVANTGRVQVWTGGPMGLSAMPTQIDAPEAGGAFARVESAGDVNGDGYGDVLVGAPLLALGGVVGAGKVWLYLGGPMGLGRVPSWSFGRAVVGGLGGSVSFLGDTNDDGFGDVVVGASLEGEGGVVGVGVAYIFRGRADGLAAGAMQRIVGPAEETGVFGHSVRSAGDLNGDKIPDLVVGTPRRIGSAQRRSGRAFIYFGDGLQLGPIPHRVYEGGTVLDSYGNGASTVGDLNGDGRTDLAIGAPNSDDNGLLLSCGMVDVIYGAVALPRMPDVRIVGQRTDARLGLAIGSDLDSDGFSDLITSAATDDAGVVAGMVRWYRGSLAGVNTANPATLVGPEVGSQYGGSLAAVGDVDRDGLAEVFVGAWGTNLLMLPVAGVAYQMTFRSGSLTPIRAFLGERAMQEFGRQLTSSF